uniref:ABC transporter ATP-binding protein n=1 Tax=Micromonospora acroterricola TaxID=2202421 RepID=UPI001F473A30|nr:ABC transporter ATP-binding protein [Micromonospora acroterricola]
MCRTYLDGEPVHALRPVDLHVEAADYVSVTGPSGSGKSTLLNILGLLDTPTSGSYRVGDVETSNCGAALRGAIRGQLFGFVFQAFHLLPGRTALENVELGMLYGHNGRRQRRRLAMDALERMGMAHRAKADPRHLSGGEKQRVAIARAVAARPRVLFCDEPTGNLDSANTAVVLDVLRQLNTDGLTLVVVTHEPEVAAEATRRLGVVDGVVVES